MSAWRSPVEQALTMFIACANLTIEPPNPTVGMNFGSSLEDTYEGRGESATVGMQNFWEDAAVEMRQTSSENNLAPTRFRLVGILPHQLRV
jgi:hypothetical protein